MKILVTGCYGFIGSRFIKLFLYNKTKYDIIGFGRNSDQKNKKRIFNYKFQIIHGDLTNDISGLLENIDIVINFAAKTHIGHSIKDPKTFIKNNIIGTYNLLEQARLYRPKLFIQISTDEVYGACLDKEFTEDAPLQPGNPYSASKASADMLVMAYHNTYKLNTIITRCENNCGPYQHNQKVIPTFIRHALNNKPLPVYGDGLHRRMWIYVEDHCRAIEMLIEKGIAGEIYNISCSQELTNIDLAKRILKRLNKPVDMIKLIPDDKIRPGHDRRYAINSAKIRKLGWRPTCKLDETIEKTISWYIRNQWWLE